MFFEGKWGERPFPHGVPGDRLWVREAWCCDGDTGDRDPTTVLYRADGEAHEQEIETHDGSPWRPSIHMPRWASRILLEITEVRVERLQDISEADARAEGVGGPISVDGWDEQRKEFFSPEEYARFDSRRRFRLLWNVINGPESWDQNPWVWALTFRRVEKT
jgi:hypothetical protein